MEKAGYAHPMPQGNINETVHTMSRILEELFKSYSHHSDFIPSIVFCIRELLRRETFSDTGQTVLEKAVDQLAEFTSKSVWLQLTTFNAIRRLNIPELIVLLISACRGLKNGFTVPVRLLLHDRLPTVLDTELFLPSYAMAVGENSSFNLGVPADGPVREARKVPLESVKKVSMSANHALFLTHRGEVFACGATINFDTGEDKGKLVVNPIKIAFPGKVSPIVDLSAGPGHSVFITEKMVYVCGTNNNFCLGLKKEACHYSMKSLKIPFPEKSKNVQLAKVYTNADCTIICSSGYQFCEMWIVGKTPSQIHETFKIVDDTTEFNYAMIRANVARIGINNELAVLYCSSKSSVFPVSIALVNYENRRLKEVKVVITNNDGVLNYTFDPRPGREPIQPCVVSINGFLVDIYCVNYHITMKGDVLLLGYLRRSESFASTSDFYTLYRGKLVVIEDKVLDDGFTEVVSHESNVSGLRVLIMLQEVPGAHTVSSFSCSPNGENLIYVTNSATIYRLEQWKTADYMKLNEKREAENLNKLDLNFHVYDIDDVCWNTFAIIIRARFPNVEKYIRDNNNIFLRDLISEVGNFKCYEIFYNYLVLNENRIVKNVFLTKSLVEDVCRVLGVSCVTYDKYYQIGHPLQCLRKFDACYDCVLVSEEGIEIKFVRSILEIQSPYFTVALAYQNSGETPRLRLCASEKLIRCTLLTIINQNYLRYLDLSEFIDLLPFLDQYLLHSVAADAIRIIFEQVNEFNVGFIFDLYDMLPQMRFLLAEQFSKNLHLITLWKNSLAASIDLLRHVFNFAKLDTFKEEMIPDALSAHFSLEPPSIYILGDNRKVDWSFFRTEDVINVLLEHPADTSQRSAICKALQHNEFSSGDSNGICLLKSCETELIATVREKILERNHTSASKRGRKKSQIHSEINVQAVEDDAKCNDSMLTLPASVEEHLDVLQQTKDHSAKSILNKISPPIESDVDDHKDEPNTSVDKSAENLSASCIALAPVVTPYKKRASGRFAPKGVKFRDARNLLVELQSGTHFAPWAGVANLSKSNDAHPMSIILEEELSRMRKTNSVSASPIKEKSAEKHCTSACNKPWQESAVASSLSSPSKPSLIEIIKEEEESLKKGASSVPQPLYIIEYEERAIEELTQLYRENVGDEVLVRVERCLKPYHNIMPSSVWTNLPHFKS